MFHKISGKMKMVNSVCIIDDDKIYRFTTEKYIQMLRLAANVMTYGDGEEAIGYLKENYHDSEKLPDIIFLDLNMPIMDGWDFIEEYIKLRPQLAKQIIVYMVSSSIDERDK
ncbi:MAG: response regulator, partial [Owenweeksia sp.]